MHRYCPRGPCVLAYSLPCSLQSAREDNNELSAKTIAASWVRAWHFSRTNGPAAFDRIMNRDKTPCESSDPPRPDLCTPIWQNHYPGHESLLRQARWSKNADKAKENRSIPIPDEDLNGC